MILADRAMLSQALLNLLQNAASTAATDIRSISTAHRNGHVALSVADKGPHPAPRARASFERFYRIDDRLSRKQEAADSVSPSCATSCRRTAAPSWCAIARRAGRSSRSSCRRREIATRDLDRPGDAE
jgi:hypothetical protein